MNTPEADSKLPQLTSNHLRSPSYTHAYKSQTKMSFTIGDSDFVNMFVNRTLALF
jgi:hypothetical protein